jgi:putative endonuclease
MKWYLYIIKCRDDSLYTGITTDIKRRIEEHNFDDKKRAKSIRGKLPVKLVYCEKFENQNNARKRESAIKNWKREYKLKLINSKSGFTL